jgi:hypothetical protein
MAAKLHQMLAIERQVTDDAQRNTTLATRGIENLGEQSPLFGISRSYQPRADDGDKLPPVSQHVQIKVENVLEMIARAQARMLDVRFTTAETNTQAKADVRVDGHTLLGDVPASYLLYLEEFLRNLKALLDKLPVLDPADEWHYDANRGVHASTAKVTVRATRVPQAQVLYEATKEHPAQVRPYEIEVPAGDWTTVKFSGALPAERKAELLERTSKLAEAVKTAREYANRIDVTSRQAGDAVFGYILGDDGVS